MTSSKRVSDTTLSTLVRGVSRFGTLCSVLAILALMTGCNPCFNFDASDDDLCTNDTCEVNDAGEATAVHTPVECTDGVCNPDDGECVECLADADCDQGFCSEAGGNVCVECVTDAHCGDSNDCTADTCVDAACVHTNAADGTACPDDANECTNDACAAGVCAHTNVADGTACDDDGNVCTGDECAAGACTHPAAADGLACDDGDLCTEADACTAGACGGTAIANCCETDADCPAGDICNVDNECETPAPDCVLNTDCDDDNPCTDDACTDGSCTATNNTAPCSDDDSCTTGDVCGGGECAGTAVTCPAGQECNPVNGNCVAIQCTSNVDCNDNLGCTVDICNLGTGSCEYTNVNVACNDGQFCSGTWTCDPANNDADGNGCVKTGNPCNNPTPVCNEATNACQACTTAAECNDNVPCTNDTCTAGSCTNAPNNGLCPNPADCDGVDYCDPEDGDADANGCVQPGNPCTPKLCNEATFVPGDLNTCTNCTSNAECSDAITCTQDVCNGGTGACSHTDTNSLCPNPAFCDGVDVCNPAHNDANATTGCVTGLPAYPCINACNENTNACFACTSNSDCNDGLPCTTDTCNGLTGACNHVSNCAIGFTCNYQTGQCED